MSGNSLLLDTNIVLYFLSGDETLIDLFETNSLFISIISEIELLGYHGLNSDEKKKTELFLNECTVINIGEEIKEKTISTRRQFRLNLPDAIIFATSSVLNIPLLTADQDFKSIEHGNIMLYES